METALENILISAYKDEMIAYLNNHPKDFEEAIELAVSDKQPFSWRAAWLLWSCMEENDRRIQVYVKRILNAIKTKEDGHQRELIKILLQMELCDQHEGYLFDICMTLWEQVNKKPSVRFTAFKFLLKMAKKHPDLQNEMDFLTQDHYLDPLTPGAKKSILKLIRASNINK